MSQARFKAYEASHVVLSRNDVFADSLAGTPLTRSGPLLFTAPKKLPAATRNEIERVLPARGKIYLLGGTGAISKQIEDELRAAGYGVTRLAGSDRIATSVAIAAEARRLNPTGTRVVLARGYGTSSDASAGWADSVAGGGWAAEVLAPVLITPSESLHPSVKAWIDGDAPTQTILLGGTAALSKAVEEAVPNPLRVAGPARDATAAEVSRQLWKIGSKNSGRKFVIVNGYRADGWAYGLAAAGLASTADAPILLVSPTAVPDATAVMVRTCDSVSAQVDLALIGSEAVISSDVKSRLDALDPTDCGGGTTTEPEPEPEPSPSPSPPPPDDSTSVKYSSWSCSGRRCSGSFGNDYASWSCSSGRCSGSFGNDYASWSCSSGRCSGSFGNDYASWSCSSGRCSGTVPYHFGAANTSEEEGFGSASWSCGTYSCSGTFNGESGSWSCGTYSCSGSFGGESASWSCGTYSCSGSFGGKSASWSCGTYSCSGSFGGQSASWSCGTYSCSGTVPYQLAAAYTSG